jgi:hypothetical protein
MMSYLKEKVAAPDMKTEINDCGVSAALTTQHPSIHEFGTKIRRTLAIAQSVYFTSGLKTRESNIIRRLKRKKPFGPVRR